MLTVNTTVFDRNILLYNEHKKETQIEFDKTFSASNRVLFRARTVFPFDFFPDEIIIDENKIDLIFGVFFFSKQVISIDIKNITGAMSMTSIFFGSLEIEINGFNKNPEKVKNLWSQDADRARRIINGLITCYKHNIDTSVLDLENAKVKLEAIGRAEK